ncbi:MAG TPA: Fe2+-dependent dioxygenase [Polyangiaceae bacterium]
MILVVERVLSAQELTTVRAALTAASFVDGRSSAGGPARDQKHVLQLERSGDAQREVGELVARALLRHATLQAATLPKSLRHPTINRYEPGMYYGPHLDAPIMRGSVTTRADVSVTVFLSEPTEYAGGELVVAADRAPISIKAAAGDAVLYPSGSIHRVSQIESGVRLVAVTWLQSMVRDAAQRKLLFELGESIALLENEGASPELLLRLRASHNDLIRMWTDV